MKKKNIFTNDEIDLFQIIKLIWRGKIKIAFITTIFFLIGVIYNYQQPNNYSISLYVKPGNPADYGRVYVIEKLISNIIIENERQKPINPILNPSNKDQLINDIVLEKFIYELEDYQEFQSVIIKKRKITNEPINLDNENLEKDSFKFIKFLEIIEPSKKDKNYLLKFRWHDSEEGKAILNETINIVSNNFNKTIVLASSELLNGKKKRLSVEQMKRIEYLREQSLIARELNISENNLESLNTGTNILSLNINNSNMPYYLRGYKAIEKEIELTKNREFEEIKIIRQEIDALMEEKIRWVIYNTNLIEVESLKNDKKNLILSILLGLIFGVFYVFITRVFAYKF
jgi:LPS O-antigen subunit length determinant protein (WzzB/FepE family)